MKCFAITALCVFLVIAAVAQPSTAFRKGTRCDSSEDCAADECCADPGMSLFRKGICQKLANEGKSCSPEGEVIRGKYTWHCPCVEGLECVAERYVKLPFDDEWPVNERCIAPTGSSAQPEPETEAPAKE